MQTAINFYVTETAAEEIKKIAEQENIENPILRVRVVPGGCSGFQYAMGFDEAINDNDQVIELANGVKVAIDEFSAPYINGATLDYVKDFMGGGFTIKNPNAMNSCGCGNSFSC
ncbi:MAG: iron-sulfur cluster assembly accessory protein [Persephonella sp.]|nr:MAG: iron-sulfur cluster assembly accessory protein [Persephonella sp.]